MAYKIVFKFSWKKYCCLPRFFMFLFSLLQSQKTSVDSSMSWILWVEIGKFAQTRAPNPTRQPVPVTHCPPGQNSCSASQTAISGCCHLVLLQIAHIQWSLQLLFCRLCPQPPCSTLNKPHSQQCSLKATCSKAPPCPHHTPLHPSAAFPSSFCPGVHTLKGSTATQPRWCHLASARNRRISVPDDP